MLLAMNLQLSEKLFLFSNALEKGKAYPPPKKLLSSFYYQLLPIL